jgi:hypothetical protein
MRLDFELSLELKTEIETLSLFMRYRNARFDELVAGKQDELMKNELWLLETIFMKRVSTRL